jgi:hypothetical protein
MSSTNYRSAYLTKLGNLTAKNLLVKLVDEGGADGLGWTSLKLIAEHTEISYRTLRRMMQVFEAMGLVKRCRVVNPFGREVDAYQLTMEMLGMDLRKQFREAHAAAQRKEPVSETGEEVVSETGEVVSETGEAVSETAPPHPLKGMSPFVPVLTLPPEVPQGGTDSPDGLDAEQLAHLERCRPEDRARWERYYRDDNAAKAAEREAAMAREASARERYPTRQAAIERIMRDCSFQRGVRKHCAIAEILGQVIDAEAARGHPAWVAGPRLCEAWESQRRAHGERIVKYGAEKFFRDGHWRNYVESV